MLRSPSLRSKAVLIVLEYLLNAYLLFSLPHTHTHSVVFWGFFIFIYYLSCSVLLTNYHRAAPAHLRFPSRPPTRRPPPPLRVLVIAPAPQQRLVEGGRDSLTSAGTSTARPPPARPPAPFQVPAETDRFYLTSHLSAAGRRGSAATHTDTHARTYAACVYIPEGERRSWYVQTRCVNPFRAAPTTVFTRAMDQQL